VKGAGGALTKEIVTVTPRVEERKWDCTGGFLEGGRAGLGHPSRSGARGARGQSLWDLHAKEMPYFMRLCGKLAEFSGELRGADQAQEADGEVG